MSASQGLLSATQKPNVSIFLVRTRVYVQEDMQATEKQTVTWVCKNQLLSLVDLMKQATVEPR